MHRSIATKLRGFEGAWVEEAGRFYLRDDAKYAHRFFAVCRLFQARLHAGLSAGSRDAVDAARIPADQAVVSGTKLCVDL